MFSLSKELHQYPHSTICQLIIDKQLVYKPFYGIRKIGITTDKKIVLLGFDIAYLVFSQGIDLNSILEYTEAHSFTIDWITFWMGARQLGMDRKTIINKLDALADQNPSDYAKVLKRLRITFNF